MNPAHRINQMNDTHPMVKRILHIKWIKSLHQKNQMNDTPSNKSNESCTSNIQINTTHQMNQIYLSKESKEQYTSNKSNESCTLNE